MGKAKPAKHTAAEINAKITAATQNKGGGKAGLADRLGGKAGHARYACNICKQQAPDLKSMEAHFLSKHPKDAFGQDKITDMHAITGGVTTAGVAVRGSLKKP